MCQFSDKFLPLLWLPAFRLGHDTSPILTTYSQTSISNYSYGNPIATRDVNLDVPTLQR